MKKAAYFGAVATVPSPNTEEYATVHEATREPLMFPSPGEHRPPETDDPLTAILRRGAQRLLGEAVEAEVDQWIATANSPPLSTARSIFAMTLSWSGDHGR